MSRSLENEEKKRSREDIFNMLDIAYTKAKEHKGSVSLFYLEVRLNWHRDEVHQYMRSDKARKLFTEAVGGNGIYYKLNFKYALEPMCSMHDYIRKMCYSNL